MRAAELAEAILGLAAEGNERMPSVDEGLHHAGVAALGGDAVEVLLHGDGVGRRLLGGRIVPLADHFHHVPFLAGGIEGLMNPGMTVGVHRGAGDAAHFEDLAAAGQVLDQPVGPEHAEALLVDVDIDRILGIENVIEGDEDDSGVLGPLDHGREGLRVLRIDNDRVIAGIDEVVDRADLGGDVLAGRDDLELLQLRRDRGLRGIGLGGLDHLNSPGIGDESVGERDAIWAGLGRVFEELRLLAPRHIAIRVARWAGNDLGPAGQCGSGDAAEQRERPGHRQGAPAEN